jgi:phosphoglycerol transferase MdoB-like AlkP superfamily enzyme
MIKLFYNNVFKNYFLLMLTLFAEEMIFRVVSGLAIIDWAVLRIFIGVNAVSLILSALYSFCGRIASNILTFLTALIGAAYGIGQCGFLNYLGVYMSFGTTSQAGAVKDYIIDYFSSFKISFYFIGIPCILLLLFYLFIDHRIKVLERNDHINFADKFDSEERKIKDDLILAKKKKKEIINSKVNALIVAIALIGVFYWTLVAPFMQNSIQLKSNKSLFINPDIPNIAMGQFGFSVYALNDVRTVLFPTGEEEIGAEFEEKYEKKEQVVTDYTRRIDDSVWEKVIENEKNSNYKKLSNYFISQEITDKNDYTGIFKDKNLIVIMMESTNNIAINQEYYPNLYKLYSEGWAWDNAYSPRNSCSTGNNEMSGMVSLYTINNSCTANIYKRNTYPEAIFNLFNKAGYTTSSYHNYTEQYYFRKTIHPNMGSGHYYGVQELGIPYSNLYHEWPSDVALVNKVLEKTENQDHYMVWVTSVSAHQPYTQDSALSKKNMDFFKNTNYNLSLKRYMSKLKEFDLAIGALLDGLEKQGKLEDTVIVLYADHYPYGLNNNTLEKYFGTSLSNYEIDRTPFIIYNSGIKAQKFDEYTSYMNIVPTVANLFNLDYDPRLYAGKDILSKTYEDRVIFADGSWRDKKAFYSATTGKITYVDNNDTYSIEELQAINKDIKNRISMSNLAIRTNYFNHLYGEINKLKEAEAKVEDEQQNTEEEAQEETTD